MYDMSCKKRNIIQGFWLLNNHYFWFQKVHKKSDFHTKQYDYLFIYLKNHLFFVKCPF